MLAMVCASLTFCIVFWSVWELGQPWIKYGHYTTTVEVSRAEVS